MEKKIIDKEILENIEHPIVKRALQKRYADFIFNYGDGGETYSDSGHTDEVFPGSPRKYNDAWKKPIPYDDHRDTWQKYSDYWDEYHDWGHWESTR